MDAYVAGLRLLARRELSEAQVRDRLTRRRFEPGAVEDAVSRLRGESAIDDRRTALACARNEAHIKRHGRLRALRQLEAIGIERSTARAAVAEVFGELDEDALISEALDRRLRGGTPDDAKALPRIHRYLLAQGFDPGRVNAVMRVRGFRL